MAPLLRRRSRWRTGRYVSGCFSFLAVATHVFFHVPTVFRPVSLTIEFDLVGILLTPDSGSLALGLEPNRALGFVVFEVIRIFLAPRAHALMLSFLLTGEIGADLLTGRVFIRRGKGI